MFLDTEDSMNDHEDTNGSKESFREQDIYLPIANVARIMKNAIPQTGKVMFPKESFINFFFTRHADQESLEFIANFLKDALSLGCIRKGMKT